MKHDRTDDAVATRRSLLTCLKDWDDQESWKQFFDTYWKLIYSVAVKARLSHAEAEDVVQETVISVARKMHDFKYDPARGSFRSWLKQLTHWRIVDQLRKRQPQSESPRRPEDDSERTPTVERVPDPASLDLDGLWEGEWRKNLMDVALRRVKRRVNAKDYQLFDLYAVKHWPVAEIAETLGVSSDQVYQAKSRITALLKKEIERLEDELI
jgi:RNA polymerase sigma-70 factor (ECF subfamily)